MQVTIRGIDVIGVIIKGTKQRTVCLAKISFSSASYLNKVD